MAQKSASTSLKEALTDLVAARDEARIKLHLLSMDAQSKWRDLESKVDALQKTAAEDVERMADESAAKARELARSVRTFVEHL
jgi:hypothetical protein